MMTKREAKSALTNLNRVEALLGPKGENWTKGQFEYYNRDTRHKQYCLLGAVYRANGAGYRTVKSTLIELLAIGRFDDLGGGVITKYNDYYGRKFADIKKLIRKVRAKFEAVLEG